MYSSCTIIINCGINNIDNNIFPNQWLASVRYWRLNKWFESVLKCIKNRVKIIIRTAPLASKIANMVHTAFEGPTSVGHESA